MKSSDLFSKAWCDLVFQGRNKAYGAYRLRQRAGHRMRFALIVVTVGAMVAAAIPVGLTLFMRYKLLASLKDVGAEVREFKRLEREKDIEVKRLSAGRGAPAVSTIKGASNDAPDIVEVQKHDIVFGVNGSETFIVDDMPPLFEDHDTLHNRNRKELPIEGPQLVATDVVEEMPQFPGGMKALMTWLDANIVYPRSCVDAKVEGDMEVTFYVDKTGHVADVKVTRSLHRDLDSAVLRAFRAMPRWVPGKQDSRISAVYMTLPIHFQLR